MAKAAPSWQLLVLTLFVCGILVAYGNYLWSTMQTPTGEPLTGDQNDAAKGTTLWHALVLIMFAGGCIAVYLFKLKQPIAAQQEMLRDLVKSAPSWQLLVLTFVVSGSLMVFGNYHWMYRHSTKMPNSE